MSKLLRVKIKHKLIKLIKLIKLYYLYLDFDIYLYNKK